MADAETSQWSGCVASSGNGYCFNNRVSVYIQKRDCCVVLRVAGVSCRVGCRNCFRWQVGLIRLSRGRCRRWSFWSVRWWPGFEKRQPGPLLPECRQSRRVCLSGRTRRVPDPKIRDERDYVLLSHQTLFYESQSPPQSEPDDKPENCANSCIG